MLSHMRIARPVTDLEKTCQMYCQGLGLQRIADFRDHQGFSGVMVGNERLGWHLEFTLCHHHPIAPSPTDDDMLVLYYPDVTHWRQVCDHMTAAGFSPVAAFNPYWDIKGRTFIDGDGYRVVVQNQSWPVR